MMRKLTWVLAFITTVAIAGVGAKTAFAQEMMQKSTSSDYLTGKYNNQAVTKDSWFFDSYAQPKGMGSEWYGQQQDITSQPEIFAGQYNNNLSNNSWFFDSYAPVNQSELSSQGTSGMSQTGSMQ